MSDQNLGWSDIMSDQLFKVILDTGIARDTVVRSSGIASTQHTSQMLHLPNFIGPHDCITLRNVKWQVLQATVNQTAAAATSCDCHMVII